MRSVDPTPTRRGESRDRVLARVAFAATWEQELGSGVMTWGDGVATMFGYARDEVAPERSWWRERFHPGGDIEMTCGDAPCSVSCEADACSGMNVQCGA